MFIKRKQMEEVLAHQQNAMTEFGEGTKKALGTLFVILLANSAAIVYLLYKSKGKNE